MAAKQTKLGRQGAAETVHRGVLIDLEAAAAEGHEPVYKALRHELKDKGIDLNPRLYAAFFGDWNMERGVPAMLRSLGRERLSSEKLLPELQRVALGVFVGKDVGPQPGLQRLLTKARQMGASVGVLSTQTPEAAAALVAKLGLTELVGEVEATGSSGLRPPGPDAWLRLARRIGSHPSGCVGIAGTSAARRSILYAGMRSVCFAHPYTAHLDFGGADAVVSEWKEAETATLALLELVK